MLGSAVGAGVRLIGPLISGPAAAVTAAATGAPLWLSLPLGALLTATGACAGVSLATTEVIRWKLLSPETGLLDQATAKVCTSLPPAVVASLNSAADEGLGGLDGLSRLLNDNALAELPFSARTAMRLARWQVENLGGDRVETLLKQLVRDPDAAEPGIAGLSRLLRLLATDATYKADRVTVTVAGSVVVAASAALALGGLSIGSQDDEPTRTSAPGMDDESKRDASISVIDSLRGWIELGPSKHAPVTESEPEPEPEPEDSPPMSAAQKYVSSMLSSMRQRVGRKTNS